MLLACVAVYLTFSFPAPLDIVVVIVLAVVAFRSSWQNLAVLLGSLLVAATAAQLLSPMTVTPPFYREHEKWARPNERYAPNVVDHIEIPHGDLLAIDPLAPAAIIDRRQQEFITDSLGYRNRREYSDQPVVMLGDSFVVGNSSDQSETLPEVLTRQFELDSYSLGYPSAPVSYERRAKAFLPRMSARAAFAFMIFEGNDFSIGRQVRQGTGFDRTRARFLGKHVSFLRYPKSIFGMSQRALAVAGLGHGNQVEVHQVGPKPVGFFQSYIASALNPDPKFEMAGDPEVLARMGCVFFIPDKYRVYREFFHDTRSLHEPAPGYLALKAYFDPHGIPVVDLTPALREAARTLLASGQYVFFRDDTHWNGHGTRAVAPVVADCLRRRLLARRTH